MTSIKGRGLIDYFCVCGLDPSSGLEAEPSAESSLSNDEGPGYKDENSHRSRAPLERSYKCKVLKFYPTCSLPWNQFDEYAVTQLCMPSGLVFQKHPSKPRFHPFLITREDGSRVYGAALNFFELVDDELICTAMQTLQTMYDATEYNSSSLTNKSLTPQAIKTISSQHHRTMSAQAKSLQPAPPHQHHYNLLKDRLYAAKSICLLSAVPFNRSFSTILQVLYNMVDQSDSLGVGIESHLYNLLYEIPLPMEGQLIQFNVGCRQQCRIYMPDLHTTVHSTDLPIYDYDMFEFVRLLGTTNMVNLFTTTLLEHQILLYSTSLSSLMLVGESLLCLLFPFVWLEPYVPIVPASNLHFIEAPVPYIMGFHSRRHDLDKDVLKHGQKCFVDIDAGQVHVPEGVPDFPDKNRLIKEINEIIQHFTQRKASLAARKKKVRENNNDDDEVNAVISTSQAYSRISELAMKVGAIKEQDQLGTNGEISTMEDEEMLNAQFARCIRELFLLKFVQMFASYEKFVITPQLNINYENESEKENTHAQLMDQQIQFWLNKDYAGNFDSKMFLIEQPSPRLPFLSHFIETQMFVRFIDLKVLSMIERQQRKMNRHHTSRIKKEEMSHQNDSEDNEACMIDPNVRIFDERIRKFRETETELSRQAEMTSSSIGFKKLLTIDIKEIEADVVKKLSQIPLQMPKVRALSQQMIISNVQHVRLFENIDESLLKLDEKSIQEISCEMKKRKEELAGSIFKSSYLVNTNINVPSNKPRPSLALTAVTTTSRTKSSRKSSSNTSRVNKQTTAALKADTGDSAEKSVELRAKSPRAQSELNPIFIQSLLKESKMKTKRMLVEKMPETANLGHVEERLVGIEENMLIAGLCDLIERIWSHGLHNKSGSSSALWNHLINYRKLIQYLRPNSQNKFNTDIKNASPTLIWCIMRKKAAMQKSILVDKTNNSSEEFGGTLPRKQRTTNMLSANSSASPPSSNYILKTPENNSTISFAYQLTQQLSVPYFAGFGSSIRSSSKAKQFGITSNGTSHKRAQSVSNNNHENGHSFSNHRQSSFFSSPLNNDLLADLERIDKLSEVKTEIGMARAFVRLSLEKKILADHLRQLLSEGDLMRARYKKHAFLRQEEEREQFIYHLQSLNVVDYFCFTNHFRSIQTNYNVLMVPSKRFNSSSTTSANPYIKLYGTLDESPVFSIPKNSLEFSLVCSHNLGQLTTARLGHDNAGMTPKWIIECIYVRNEITGHIYQFPCGRWIGKGVDDDSLERLLIAESVNWTKAYELSGSLSHSFSSANGTNGNGCSSTATSPYGMTRSRSPTLARSVEEKKTPTSSSVQEKLGNSINTLVKYFEKPEIERSNLTSLMCGENGLVSSMDELFTFGFKYQKLFKRLYVWDFLEKACLEFESYSSMSSHHQSNKSSSDAANNSNASTLSSLDDSQHQRNFIIDKYRCMIKAINVTSCNYGKDGKFQIFICLACRDSFLADWFMLLSGSMTANQMYDEYSFMRNNELKKFAAKILSIINQFNFKLENSLTMGINY